MANNRGIRWFHLWWAFLFCFLCTSVADASIRRYPALISGSKATGGSAARNGNSLVTSNALEGEWISKYGRKMHIPVEQGSYWSIHGTIINAQGMFRRNLPALVMGGAIAGIGYGLDWLFDEADQQWKKQGEGELLEPEDLNLYCRETPYQSQCAPSASTFCDLDPHPYAAGWEFPSENKINCLFYSGGAGTTNPRTYYSGNKMSQCPEGSRYDQSRGGCVADGELVPITEADIAQIAPEISGADPAFIQDILRNACNGSNAPESCFESLMEKTQLNGPSNVTTPSTTSTTTVTGPDGVAGTSTSTTNTTFNLTYGPNYYQYTTTTTTTTTRPDGTTETTTETDAPPEDTPPDYIPEPEIEDVEIAKPCTGDNCGGPAYADLYTPTEMKKESVLDEYVARASAIPIYEAVTGFFDVSVSAACPVWTTDVELNLWGMGFDYTLLFDYHCQPWFTDYRPYAMAVFLIFSAYLAFRIALL